MAIKSFSEKLRALILTEAQERANLSTSVLPIEIEHVLDSHECLQLQQSLDALISHTESIYRAQKDAIPATYLRSKSKPRVETRIVDNRGESCS